MIKSRLKHSTMFALLLGGTILPSSTSGQSQGLVSRWSFDESTGATTRDSVSGTADQIEGYVKRVPGVSGNGLRFDGISTHVVRKGKDAPIVRDGVTVEAWAAIDQYPWNWVPIAEQVVDQQAGYFFGVDAFGHIGFQAAVEGVWQSVTSTAQLPLKRWAHIVGTFDASRGLRIYIDGKEVGRLETHGRMNPAFGSDVLIGRVYQPTITYPTYALMYPVFYSLDGILDELSIYDRGMTPEEVEKAYAAFKAPEGEVLPWPGLPSGPAGAGRFGAYNTTLKYQDTWDANRRFGPDSDVVVRFDESPMRLVFWQGTSYVPTWVTENGKWYTDEWVEAYESCPDLADCEPISDKQNRYSHVSVLESNDARAVVHWRYALNEGANYKGAHTDPLTGWFDWVDEYWTVYPDGVAVRKQVVWTTDTSKPFEFQETIIIDAPGQRPEDTLNLDALSIGNLKGQTATYTWESKDPGSFTQSRGPGRIDKPENPNIQIVNLKSTWKPFQIVSPKNSSFDTYNAPSYFTFPCWNHWPVAEIASSNRPCVATDRPSHTSLSHIYWDTYEKTDHTVTKLLLNGLTTKPAADLVPLAKSWLSPPKLDVSGQGFVSEGYDPAQRAFVVTREGPPKVGPLELMIHASNESPAINPTIVIKNWSEKRPQLHINGKAIPWSKDLRCGLVERLEGTDLIVWIRKEAATPLTIGLSPPR